MAEKKDSKKYSTYRHRENDYFLLSMYNHRLQFIKGEYTAKNDIEERILAEYSMNPGDIELKR